MTELRIPSSSGNEPRPTERRDQKDVPPFTPIVIPRAASPVSPSAGRAGTAKRPGDNAERAQEDAPPYTSPQNRFKTPKPEPFYVSLSERPDREDDDDDSDDDAEPSLDTALAEVEEKIEDLTDPAEDESALDEGNTDPLVQNARPAESPEGAFDFESALEALVPATPDSGIFEVTMPGGETMGVAVNADPTTVSFLLSPSSDKLADSLRPQKMELEGKMERRMQRNVKITVL